jgi:RNA polymerase sigma-70 factor, ECF subfamily
MLTREQDLQRGLAALRVAIRDALAPAEALAGSGVPAGWLSSDAVEVQRPRRSGGHAGPASHGRAGRPASDPDDSRQASSSEADEAEAARLIALVELARGGDAEAFGTLYDHYHVSVYRFVYYRVGSAPLAEDLTSETFLRALRGMSSFRWQGKDFGAWLMTIARNLTTDHFKSGRSRLEYACDDLSPHEESMEGPETAVLESLTNQTLLRALTELGEEQQECLVMRFLQGLSIAETAQVLDRSEGAVKQLQLRAVRNLAKRLPEDLR